MAPVCLLQLAECKPGKREAAHARRHTGTDPTKGSAGDDLGLGGRQAAGGQDRVQGGVPLDERERDGAVLVVPADRGEEADRASVQLERVASYRQRVTRAVEVQEHQASRRTAEVVHPGDCLLAAVAALVQVDGGPQPVDLVRDGAVVGLEAQPGPPSGDPQRLGGPGAGQRPVAHDGDQVGASHQQLAPRALLPGWSTTVPYAAVSPTSRGHGSLQASGSPATVSARTGSPSTAQSAVTSATSTRSMKRIESSQAVRAAEVPGSVVIQVVCPSSTRCRSCSMWPLGLSTSDSVEVSGGRPVSICVVIEWSHDSRSGPVTVTTPRWDRSTAARPSVSSRCSRSGSP